MKDYAVYICVAIAVFVIGTIIALITKKGKNRAEAQVQADNRQGSAATERDVELPPERNPLASVSFNKIDAVSSVDETKLVEIKDKQLLSRIDGVIPGTMQAVVNSASIVNYSKSAGQLYQVIIPTGEKLSKSLDMEGAVRAFSQDSKGRIKHVANLVAVDDAASQKLATANAVNAVMGVAAMVVGQYYMTQINKQLDKVSDQLKNIESFQENELKGKILALTASIQKSATFQYEVLQNNDVRNRELAHLKNLELECAELLGQVNMTLQGKTQTGKTKYGKYENDVYDIQTWLEYQQILLNLMGKIGDLTYALNLGAITKENAYAMCLPYAKQSNDVQVQLLQWHHNNLQQLGIKIFEGKRKRQGLGRLLMSVPAVFNEKLKYKGIPEETADLIRQQLNLTSEIVPEEKTELFQKDVQLIAKEGKLYYLPATQ